MNELSYFTGNTRKRQLTVSDVSGYIVCKWLHRLHIYGIMRPDHRKECRNNDCYGRIPDTRRNCKDPQKVRGHRYKAASARQIAGLQSRRFMDRQQKGLRQLVSRTKQLRQTKGQIKIATHWWQTTIDNFVAANSPLPDWYPHRSEPRNPLPTFSIATYGKICQGEVIQEKGMRRKCARHG
jgi:hypothetical protein